MHTSTISCPLWYSNGCDVIAVFTEEHTNEELMDNDRECRMKIALLEYTVTWELIEGNFKQQLHFRMDLASFTGKKCACVRVWAGNNKIKYVTYLNVKTIQ